MIADCGLRIADCFAATVHLRKAGCCAYACVSMLRLGLAVALLLVVFLCAGCAETPAQGPAVGQPGEQASVPVSKTEATEPEEPPPPVVPTGFAPARVSILPLTELPTSTPSSQAVMLNAYISLYDAFGCQIKAPGAIRFELYQRVARSGQPKGQRLAIWPDIDLTHPAINNKYWRDFLRAYEFKLDAPAGLNEPCILEATYMCPDGRRLTAEFPLKGSR